jgi:hypothetical protein
MRFLIQDHTGHSVIDFAPTDAGVKEAMEKFKALVEGEKKTPAKRTGNGESTVIRGFDPTAEEVLFIRPMVGG